MEKRILDNGNELYRVNSPLGKGHIYFVPAGNEGMIQVLDTYMTSLPTVAQAVAWELDEPPPEYRKPELKYQFNKG